MVVSVLFGFAAALARLSNSAVLVGIASFYTVLPRHTLLIQILLIYLGLPQLPGTGRHQRRHHRLVAELRAYLRKSSALASSARAGNVKRHWRWACARRRSSGISSCPRPCG